MCGRYASSRSAEELAAFFDAAVEEPPEVSSPEAGSGGANTGETSTGQASTGEASTGTHDTGKHDTGTPKASAIAKKVDFNVAPTKTIPIIREPSGQRLVSAARWGLLPSWAKDLSMGSKMFNARAESVATKPSFRSAFAKKRCLIPADGWYEWAPRADGTGKQAYFMSFPEGPVTFAGLWEVWRSPEQEWVLSASIITTAAAGNLATVHTRMPLMLAESRWAQWLGEQPGEPEQLLATPSADLIASVGIRPVSAKVGNVRNNGHELTESVPDEGPVSAALS